MQTTEIRKLFLNYFQRNDHEIVPSSSLVPVNDPTLLFVNAGMVQFKEIFLGVVKRPYTRATTSQRCVRAGGKHNDLENVGYTARHHTFFEMLGNFSFGDYFKREAIQFAWQFLTKELKLPKEKLWVTVFETDDEAADIWLKEIGVAKNQFARIGAHDNFWSMGDTGPCGPCSEIFYDHGPDVAGGPPGSPDEDGDRYVEIWNLVFMQYNRDGDGNLEPLPKPSVDTGMGLERLAAVLQGVQSNYDTDLFKRLIKKAANLLGVDDWDNKSLRVIADHIRSTAFLIVDGVTPSNEGRGYVLRRIIRRAIRHGYRLGGKTPFFHKLVSPLVKEMGEAYPELAEAQGQVTRVLKQEGEKFAETLEQGLRIIDSEIRSLKGKTIPGETVFKLYDTYGFPADLTADVAREHDLDLDYAGFELEMDAQRKRARAASQFGIKGNTPVLDLNSPTIFTGYQSVAISAKVLTMVKDDKEVEHIFAGEDAMVVLDQTPFYPESGGQVGDRGLLKCGDAVFDVLDTQKLSNDLVGQLGRMRVGDISKGDKVNAEIDISSRNAIANNHSATHLLHAALKQVLGAHVQQKGSLVESERLRFDFSHFEPVAAAQIDAIETLINREIRANHLVETRLMNLEEAKAAGAAALFGEKYELEVRVVGMGEFSLELCGGTHVKRTGDIGLCKITAETGIAAGVRRIEAVTGKGALEYVSRQQVILNGLSQVLKVGSEEVLDRTTQLGTRVRQLEKEVQQLHAQLATAGDAGLDDALKTLGDVKVMVKRQDGADAKTLRNTIDALKEKLQKCVIVLGAASDNKATVIAGVTHNLTDRIHSGKLIQHLAPVIGGKGGGKADLAQGGGPEVEKLNQALDSVYAWVEQQLS